MSPKRSDKPGRKSKAQYEPVLSDPAAVRHSDPTPGSPPFRGVPVHYSEQEIAAYLTKSVRTVKRLRERGELKFIRIAGSPRCTSIQLSEYIKQLEVDAGQT